MENNFDKEVKKMLEDFEVEYTPSNWDLMEEKIEEHSDLNPELEDVFIDGIALDNLQDLEEPYNPEHWNLMREKLDAVYAFRRKLMKYKVAEVALVLLFIFTLFQFLPIKNKQTRDIASTVSNEATLNDIQNNSSDHSQELFSQKQNLKESSTTSIANNTSQNQTVESTFNSKGSISNSQKKNSASHNTTVSIPEQSSILNDGNPTTNELLEANEIRINNSIAEKAVDQNNPFQENKFNASLLAPISLKESETLQIAGIEELNGSKIFSDLKKPIKVRVGMAVGADANYVMTPYDQKNFLDEFNQLALGYSGGFTLGFKYNKWEIETGALYSAVSYESRNVFEIKGSFAEGGYFQQGLEGAQIDLVRIPLNLKYNFFTKKKWNVYAYTGTSVNMMVETFYNFTTTDVGNSEATTRDNFASNGRNTDSEEELKYESHDGLFEGGQLSKNTFMTANLGFGIERYFTPRMSIFLQPGYQHQFSKGLGPQADQINSISILTGAKVTLKKRKKQK